MNVFFFGWMSFWMRHFTKRILPIWYVFKCQNVFKLSLKTANIAFLFSRWLSTMNNERMNNDNELLKFVLNKISICLWKDLFLLIVGHTSFLMNRKIHAFYEAFLHRLIEVGLEQIGRISKPRFPVWDFTIWRFCRLCPRWLVEFREKIKCQI